jgi:DP-EP family
MPKKHVKSLNELELIVPLGGQRICILELMPQLPSEKDGHWHASKWQLDEVGSKGKKGITGITVGFHENPVEEERLLERAVLIVNIKQNPLEKHGTWRFALNGAAAKVKKRNEDIYNDIALEITNDGLTLTAFVHVYEDSVEHIQFGYVASFTHNESGKVDIYESSDPGFVPIRPA